MRDRAKAYIREHNLKNISLMSLKSAAAADGHTVIEFNNVYNDENEEYAMISLDDLPSIS